MHLKSTRHKMLWNDWQAAATEPTDPSLTMLTAMLMKSSF
jgi:hypothetical protein